MSHQDPQFKARIDPETKRWLEQKAKSMRLSQNWLINQALKEMMQREQKETA